MRSSTCGSSARIASIRPRSGVPTQFLRSAPIDAAMNCSSEGVSSKLS